MSLLDTLKQYADSGAKRFHTPSHSGRDIYGALRAEYDVTELSFSDNLESPHGVLQEAESNVAKAYGVERSLLFTSGATTAIFTALLVAKQMGDTIIIIGDCHKSVINAAQLFGLKLRYYGYNDAFAIHYARQLPQLTKTAIEECPGASAIFITTPDYFGRALPVQEIAEIAHRHGKLLIADEAHGSHFAFSKLLPEGAARYADLCIESVHKTLPVATGGALLNVSNAALTTQCLLARKLINSTSPSYPIMADIEQAVTDFAQNAEDYYTAVLQSVRTFWEKLNKPFNLLPHIDFSRVVFTVNGVDGGEVFSYLEQNGIYAEMLLDNTIVLIVSPQNHTELRYTANVLIRYANEHLGVSYTMGCPPCNDAPKATLHCICAQNGAAEPVSIEKAVGKRAYLTAGLYPPALPLIISGEVVSQEAADRLLAAGDNTFGVQNGCVFCIKE